MRPRFTPMLVLMLTVGWALAAAPVPKASEKKLEEKIVGVWKLVPPKGEDLGYTLHVEYKAAGKLEIRYEYAGNLLPRKVYQGTYKALEPDAEYKLGRIEWTVTEDGETRAEVARIDKLTDDELTEVDPEGVAEHFERVKGEKKGEQKDK